MRKYFSLLYLFAFFLLNQIISFPAKAFSINHPTEYTTVESLKNANNRFIPVLQEHNSAQFILLLPKATVVNEGGIITLEGKVLKDTQTSLNDQHRLFKKNRNINTENPLFFNGKLVVLSSPGSENWYHWLLQVLPRLIILKESKIEFDKIYINNCQFLWQISSLKEVLKFLDISEDKLLIVNGDCIIQAETLIVPSVPFIPIKGTPLPQWLQANLRKLFLNPEKSTITAGEKVYISRASAKTRRISNEKKLIKELKKLNFNIVTLENLSPYDQAKIFNTAKIIVGPHGSGFTNLIFTKKGTKIIEIDHGCHPPRSFFERMAKFMECEYYPFYVDHTTEDHLEDDINVNIRELKEFIINSLNGKTTRSNHL